jgi:poly(3-hydroxybutyrate) depolymerase
VADEEPIETHQKYKRCETQTYSGSSKIILTEKGEKMTDCVADEAKPRFTWIDHLLLTTSVGLSAILLLMLAGPTITWWQHRPRPGMQVEQQRVVQAESLAYPVAPFVNYLLYLPPDYTWRSKWPLVVYLHGAGSRGNDLNIVRREGLPGLVEHGKKFNFILVSPQCPKNTGWSPELLVGLVQYLSSSLSVDQNRIYMTGYSMGGNGTWATAIYKPDLFAAIAPLAGGGNAELAERLVHIPIWAFHGEKDRVIPLKATKEMVDAVRKSGGNVKFTVYPNADHGICGLTYQNPALCNWLLAQRKGLAQQRQPEHITQTKADFQ